MNTYISENFRDFSGKFQNNFTGFQNNFKMGSENFNEISQDFRPILENCSEISRKIQKKVSNPKSKSRQKALQFMQEAKLAAMQNDVYEAKVQEKKLNGLLGTLQNLEANRAKYVRKQRNRRQMKIAVVFTMIVGTTAFAIIQGVEYKYNQFVSAQPINIEQEINAFASAYNIKVYPYSRQKIAEAVAKGKDLKQTVDSVLTTNYKIRK